VKGGNIISVTGGSWRRLAMRCALQEQHQEEFTALQKSSNLAQDGATGEAGISAHYLCWLLVENTFAAWQHMPF